ncbi:site-specific integrase [Bradyrhizobium sp. AUGA SZCCT0182]|uniref:tyrosine-type recombinase/integrase n=1 Tax=Bradyrhizobium sp. AUGA SZCCT0182 TaxID=2807667 RepID=UPI001BAA7F82|nr:site-specific integrase [Bradyrhizobium sp. AUGA SZCCT0182]MBR1237656.1 integrase arm-type DNA-binding domain-containing protein [Bradyrhizobium sp. AUGA SZCCT0182]
MVRQLNKLSSRIVETVKDAGRYADGGGLYLQVSAGKNGGVTKSWLFRYMRGGTTSREMGLGPVSVNKRDGLVTLSMARDTAFIARKALSAGLDPLAQREQERLAGQLERAKTLTFKECAERYIAAHEAGWKSKKHADQYRMTLLALGPKGKPALFDYCKLIRDLPVAAVDTALVLKIIEPIWSTKTETASRIRGRIETVLDWAKARGYRQGENPAAWRGHLAQLLPAKSQVAPVENHPALPYAELPAFMAKLRSKEGVSARALEFTILTVARTGDTIGATWQEINKTEKLWTVPAARVKGKKGARKRDHVVPLSEQALAILEGLPADGDYIFPGGKDAAAGLSNAAMDQMLKGMNEEREAVGLPLWKDPQLDRSIVPHGFRSTFLDWGHDTTNYPKEMLDIALAHTVPDKVEAAYRRGNMREKRRRMMADWARYCAKPVRTDRQANVIDMRAAR